MSSLRIFLFLLAIPAAFVNAQVNKGCVSYDYATQWPNPHGSASGPDQVPTRTRLAELLEGTYTLTLVTTEGVLTPVIAQWRFALIRADTAAIFDARPERLHPVMAGTRLDVASPTPLDTLRRGRFLSGTDITMWVEPKTGNLRWRTAPGALDAGLFFDVSTIDSTGFQGRWRDGSIAVALLRRGPLEVAEVARGYYCAWKGR